MAGNDGPYLERQRLAQERLQNVQRSPRLTMVLLAGMLLVALLMPMLNWAHRWGFWNFGW
jgi:hypothetical protein